MYIIIFNKRFLQCEEVKMIKKFWYKAILVALSLIMLACGISLGGGEVEQVQMQTAVAQTLTAASPVQTETSPPPQPTNTTAPTNTEQVPPTKTPLPCHAVQFISETIPDNTVMDPNEEFTKTWRFKNVGTCTWNTNYKIIFAEGDKMSGPSSKNLTQTVAPGEQVDLVLNLTAPGANGTYKGTWKVQDDQGQIFIHNIWVQIKVVKPLTEKNITLEIDEDEGGSVWENGDVYPTDYVVGDAVGDWGIQSFQSFNISSIPSNATIVQLKVDFSDYATLGNPFNQLGCLELFEDSYRPLSAGDYHEGATSGALVKWCTSAQLTAITVEEKVKTALQNRLGNTYFQLRLQFTDKESNGDNGIDSLGFNEMKLMIKYEY